MNQVGLNMKSSSTQQVIAQDQALDRSRANSEGNLANGSTSRNHAQEEKDEELMRNISNYSNLLE